MTQLLYWEHGPHSETWWWQNHAVGMLFLYVSVCQQWQENWIYLKEMPQNVENVLIETC